MDFFYNYNGTGTYPEPQEKFREMMPLISVKQRWISLSECLKSKLTLFREENLSPKLREIQNK
jgi:hypothetical protein